MAKNNIYTEIALERARQDKLVATGKLPFNCADPGVHEVGKLPILVEEVGEIATEIYEIENALAENNLRKAAGKREFLREELIQLAAVSVAMIEAIDATNT